MKKIIKDKLFQCATVITFGKLGKLYFVIVMMRDMRYLEKYFAEKSGTASIIEAF